jgi:hypothetical protein
MKYVPGERFESHPKAGAWAAEYFCSSCGWRAKLDADPRRCPKCRHVTQREQSTVDSLLASPTQIVAGVFVAGVAGWLLWTALSFFSIFELISAESGEVNVTLDCVRLVETDEGYVARFRLNNESTRALAEVKVSVKIFAEAEGTEAQAEPVVTKAIQFGETLAGKINDVDLPLGTFESGAPWKWTAGIDSFELPADFSNSMRKARVTISLVGDRGTTATPFPAAVNPPAEPDPSKTATEIPPKATTATPSAPGPVDSKASDDSVKPGPPATPETPAATDKPAAPDQPAEGS